MKELLVERSVPRFAAARAAAMLAGSGNGIGVGPLRLVDREAPPLPGPGWHRIRPRLSGICGSDLSTIDGVSSRYFEEIVSFPFVLGHEIVGSTITAPSSLSSPGTTCNWDSWATSPSDQPPPVSAQKPVCRPGFKWP